MEKYVLSIDCGTQSVRGIVFDHKGKMLVKDKRAFEPYISLNPGWAEHKAEMFWGKTCEVTNFLKKNHKEIMDKVNVVVITTQRDSCVLLDRDGKVLRPVILWMDNRMIKEAKPIRLKNKLPTALVGMKELINTMNKGCSAHWIQENEPEIWENTHKYLQISGYLNYKLTGEFKDSVASQIGHIPFDYKKFKWEKPGSLKSEIFQIEPEKLCELVEPSSIIGKLTKQAAEETGLPEGTIVCAGGSDKGCETLGVGCFDNKMVSISLGSIATVQTTTPVYYETERFMPPYPAVIKNRYNPEISINCGYWMITWFKREFAAKEIAEAQELGITPEDLLSKKLNEIKPGCEGLILQPYWIAAAKQPEARGSIIGFSDYHTRIHIYRAIVEGIGFALYEGMKKMEKRSGIKIEKISISGGGSQSDEICQITANIFNIPVQRVQTAETSALGAAITGYVCNGVYKTYEEAVENMVHVKDVFLPEKEETALYDKLYEDVYRKIYKKLKPLYEKIKDII